MSFLLVTFPYYLLFFCMLTILSMHISSWLMSCLMFGRFRLNFAIGLTSRTGLQMGHFKCRVRRCWYENHVLKRVRAPPRPRQQDPFGSTELQWTRWAYTKVCFVPMVAYLFAPKFALRRFFPLFFSRGTVSSSHLRTFFFLDWWRVWILKRRRLPLVKYPCETLFFIDWNVYFA